MSRAPFFIRPSAEAELGAIEGYLSENAGPEIAARFLEAASEAFGLLASQPGMGREWKSTLPRLQRARAWPLRLHQGYLVLYRPLEPKPGIEVLHVFHGARDIPAILDEEDSQ